mmetsp:Transcript_11306/g.37366  ORF Transcript_11306/g.37366 Transcript_11306/m.37366 type:complete len:298 (-) Transcript_11306:4723-5616(-)
MRVACHSLPRVDTTPSTGLLPRVGAWPASAGPGAVPLAGSRVAAICGSRSMLLHHLRPQLFRHTHERRVLHQVHHAFHDLFVVGWHAAFTTHDYGNCGEVESEVRKIPCRGAVRVARDRPRPQKIGRLRSDVFRVSPSLPQSLDLTTKGCRRCRFGKTLPTRFSSVRRCFFSPDALASLVTARNSPPRDGSHVHDHAASHREGQQARARDDRRRARAPRHGGHTRGNCDASERRAPVTSDGRCSSRGAAWRARGEARATESRPDCARGCFRRRWCGGGGLVEGTRDPGDGDAAVPSR